MKTRKRNHKCSGHDHGLSAVYKDMESFLIETDENGEKVFKNTFIPGNPETSFISVMDSNWKTRTSNISNHVPSDVFQVGKWKVSKIDRASPFVQVQYVHAYCNPSEIQKGPRGVGYFHTEESARITNTRIKAPKSYHMGHLGSAGQSMDIDDKVQSNGILNVILQKARFNMIYWKGLEMFMMKYCEAKGFRFFSCDNIVIYVPRGEANYTIKMHDVWMIPYALVKVIFFVRYVVLVD